jgi:hypothetical protein
MRLLCRRLHRFADIYERLYPWLQGTCFLVLALLTLWGVVQLPIPEQYNLLTAVTYKVIIYLVVMGYITILTYGPLLWVHMIEATPQAMLKFGFISLLVQFLFLLVARLQRAKIRPHLWFQGKRPCQSGRYSLANLFSVAAVPYRLYPLSCCQLE